MSTSTLRLVRPDKFIAVPATEFDGLITHIALIDVEVVEHLMFGRLGRGGCRILDDVEHLLIVEM